MSGALSHSAADVIRHLLIDLGLGTLPTDAGSWPIYATITPETPDSAITITDTESLYEGRDHTSGEVQEHHGIQIAVRDANHVDGYVKMDAIKIAIDQTVRNDSVPVPDASGTGSTTYVVHCISRKSGILVAGKGATGSKRHLFTINAVAALRQTS